MDTLKMRIRPAAERGVADLGWLASRHSFSFGHYHDPAHMGFCSLRVINDDRVQPGQGFGTHPHRDMEIISIVVEGALEHKDSLGTGSIIRPGEVQRMSAGTGVMHSEFNPSQSDEVHFLQIWIEPERNGLPPSYEQRAFPFGDLRNNWKLVASRDGRHDSLTVHQDVSPVSGTAHRGFIGRALDRSGAPRLDPDHRGCCESRRPDPQRRRRRRHRENRQPARQRGERLERRTPF